MNRLRRLRRSAGFAWEGLRYAWQLEPNLRLEAGIGGAVLALALWLGTGVTQVLLAGTLVLSMELINSAVESLVDLISPTRHPLAKAAKDTAAAAVMVSAVVSIVVGLIVLGPALLLRLGIAW